MRKITIDDPNLQWVFVRHRNRIPDDMRCPITGERLIQDVYPNFRTEHTSRIWVCHPAQSVIESTNGKRAYQWVIADDMSVTMERVTRYNFESTLGSYYTVSHKYVKYPKTYWDAFRIGVNNWIRSNRIVTPVWKLFRKIKPKGIGFPLIRKVHARTVGLDLVSVQPLAFPDSQIFTFDIVSDPGYAGPARDKQPETKGQEHVIIRKVDDQPKAD